MNEEIRKMLSMHISPKGGEKRDAHLELTAVGDDDGAASGTGLSTLLLDSLDDIHTLDDLTEDDVLAIEPAGDDSGDEELTAVGVGTSVGHGKKSGLGVTHLEVLILELVAIDGLTTSAVATSEITTLKHEVGDHTVERAALVAEGLAGAANTLLTSAEAAEVLSGLGHDIAVELEDDTASRSTTDGDIEEHLRARHCQ